MYLYLIQYRNAYNLNNLINKNIVIIIAYESIVHSIQLTININISINTEKHLQAK